MAFRDPYQVIKHRHVTEKTTVLENLKNATSNRSVSRCESPKYVFLVDPKANKQEIKQAIESIYKEQNVKVAAVNTINIKGKPRRVRGRKGRKPSVKKAVVTLEKGDSLDNI